MSAVIEVEYEVDTGTVQQWAQRMPVLVVVNLYRITRTWEPPAEPSDQGDNTEEQVK